MSQFVDERENEFLVSSNAEELGGNVLVVIASDTRQVRTIHQLVAVLGQRIRLGG